LRAKETVSNRGSLNSDGQEEDSAAERISAKPGHFAANVSDARAVAYSSGG
jgi:hypothetical protein